MNQAPSVFVPTPPEGDGVLMPTLLSVLVHGLLIGLVIYTHQVPKLDTATPIETTMVSPEQLAQIQSQILANRAANAGGANATSDLSELSGSPDSTELTADSLTNGSTNGSSTNGTSANAAVSRSTRVPTIFRRSDDPADSASDDGLLISQEQRARIDQANREYEQKMAEIAAQIDADMANDSQAVAEAEAERERIRRERVRQLKDIEAKGPLIKKPKAPAKPSAPDDRSPTSVDLADGEAKVAANSGSSGSSKSSSGNSSGGGSPARSVGAYKNDIVSKIQSKFIAPVGSENDYASLSLRLDSRGNVQSASASGSNPAVNAAAEDAAFAASPLPIDLDNPKAFASIKVRIKGS